MHRILDYIASICFFGAGLVILYFLYVGYASMEEIIADAGKHVFLVNAITAMILAIISFTISYGLIFV